MNSIELANIAERSLSGAEVSMVVYTGEQAKEANIMYQQFCKLRDTKEPLAIRGTVMSLTVLTVDHAVLPKPELLGFLNPNSYRVVVHGVFNYPKMKGVRK